MLSLIRKKRRVYRIAKRTGSPKHRQQYKVLCNTVRRITRRDRNAHLQQITSNLQHDQKPFWRWLKSTKGGHRNIPDIHQSGNILSSALEKATALNTFFTSVFTKEVRSNFNKLRERLFPSRSKAEITDIVFNSDNVFELISAIDPSKSSGPDNIPGRLLKEGAL